MRIVVVGTGYVGLVSGACFSDFGHHVTCVDKDDAKISSLRRGEIPIFEPDLERLVQSNARAGRLVFTTDLAGPVTDAEVVFIAVGTPSRRGDGHADLSYVYAASREIAKAVRNFAVVVTKSTVPVGTGDEVERIFMQVNPSADVSVVSNPEFLREGAAVRDFKHPDRIVVGTTDERARKVMGELARIEMPDIQYSGDPYECAAGADALVIVTAWEQFRALDLDRLKREMACPVIVDLRNVYDSNELTKRGFLYQSIRRAG
jgi:UDPglucose 6-dehydrogenase